VYSLKSLRILKGGQITLSIYFLIGVKHLKRKKSYIVL
jgi:hypothetical protein